MPGMPAAPQIVRHGLVVSDHLWMRQPVEMAMIDHGKLHQFIGQLLGDLGGASSVAMVRIGDALGIAAVDREAHRHGSGKWQASNGRSKANTSNIAAATLAAPARQWPTRHM